MVVCDFNICFTFISHERFVNDVCIFNFAISNFKNNFKYYLINVEYLIQRDYIKLYTDTRYYFPDFSSSNRLAEEPRETFNQCIILLRVITCIWCMKERWTILRDMLSYDFDIYIHCLDDRLFINLIIWRHSLRIYTIRYVDEMISLCESITQ
ncbi:hypothetical protein KSP40_PGU018113 [Platanthera guangdongensis]|uniref:Uncharacterized protein n=1 Tax=Platanthera guangdongensis TaxID=2320717 RepID=A0ABR2MGV1_9ASPA